MVGSAGGPAAPDKPNRVAVEPAAPYDGLISKSTSLCDEEHLRLMVLSCMLDPI